MPPTDGALALQHLRRQGWGVRLDDQGVPRLQRIDDAACMTDTLRAFAREHREAIITELKGGQATQLESTKRLERAVESESTSTKERAITNESTRSTKRANRAESAALHERATPFESTALRERANILRPFLQEAMNQWDMTPSCARHTDDFERIMRALEQLMQDPESKVRLARFRSILDDEINDLTTRWLHDEGFERVDSEHLIREHVFLAPLPAGCFEVYCEILWPGGEGAPAIAKERRERRSM